MKKNDDNLVDVTDQIFGTKNNSTKKATESGIPFPESGSQSTDAPAMNLPEGFEPVNPPKKPLPKDIVPAEILERQKVLDKLFVDQTRNFIKIGFHLLHFQESREYKPLGYSKFEDFVKSEYGLSKSTAYNYIKVCVKYSAKDDDGKPTAIMAKEYSKFKPSQLVALLGMNDDFIAQVDPEKTAREIKKEIKDTKNYIGEFDPDEESEFYGDQNVKPDEKPKKKNSRDMTIPVMRLSMARGQTWDEVVTDSIRKTCETYLTKEKRDTDGNDYMIEICITYPDKTAI